MTDETKYLLATEANKRHLLDSVQQLSEAEALVTLVGFAKEDKDNGRVTSSLDFKERLKKRKDKLLEDSK